MLVFFCLLLPVISYAWPTDTVRVQVLDDASTFRMKISGRYEIKDAQDKKSLYRGRDLNSTVTAYAGGIVIAGNNFPANRVFININDPDVIEINARPFRGDIQIIKSPSNTMSVINYIGLEDYVKGILYHEASHYWPMEALKAQAIVSRSYARYQMKENAAKDFDMTNDIYSQVYGGSISERQRTNKAVEDTQGAALFYKGELMPAFFHATCGGHTEDAARLWKINMPPLKGVPCRFCKESPHYSWHAVLFTGDIRQALVDAGKRTGVIKKIIIMARDNSSRITDLKIINTKSDYVILAKDFRNIVGPNIIKSTNFNVSITGTDAVFEGVGWGHGVGLCQWGAYFMAKEGQTAEAILDYYYPGADVKTL